MSKNKDKAKSPRKKQKVIAGLSFIAIAILVGVGVYILYGNNLQKVLNKSNNTIYQRKGTDGKPASMTEYYEKSIEAWRSGDKAEAKLYAQKALDENNRMTNDNQAKVENQPEIVEDALAITKGEEPSGAR